MLNAIGIRISSIFIAYAIFQNLFGCALIFFNLTMLFDWRYFHQHMNAMLAKLILL